MATYTSVLQPPKVINSTLGRGQGVAGPAGAAGGAGADYIAASPLSGHQVIAIDSAGQAIYASSDNAAHALRIAGVSVAAAAAAAPVTVMSAGLIEHGGWSWTPGQPVFVGLNGVLTQTLPPTSVYSRVIGQAVGATRLLVDLQPPITLAT